ncbi:amino acid adenylation domain-containing protein [Mycetohabitans sp. B8]|uniref:non-ribosomal peptide synthetase n=1 Tax=Mycetohabitans sp. B8 TaxID=2841845 RepID=UPI001F29D3B2|nr:non-ribosomal peptide synthetase [Mycetohabitans sp. B8]MCG1042949.1 amino acid adenylation domain-containing protein [Mycetohabitans sp. B8]
MMAVSATPLATYSLSSEQKEIWLAQQLHPDIPANNIAQYTVIEGAIDPAVFEAALCQVIGEVDSLRLQFFDSSEGLRQAIGSPAWSMPVLDLSAEANPHTSAQAWMRADYEQPVDLVQGPLFCYALLKAASGQWIWYQRYCHIIIDGYGAVLIAQRVSQVYSAMRAGKKPEPCAFGSVLQLLDSDAQQASAQRERDEAYWLKQCADWTEPTTLVSRAAPLLQHRLRQTAYLPTQALGDFMTDTGRLAQILTVALAVYLHRMTGVQDVVLGLPVTARLGADRYIPGTLAHDIPLQFTMQSGMNLSSLLQQAAQQIQRGFRYQRYPSEALRCRLELPPGQALFGATVNVMPFDYDMSFDGYPSTNHNLLNGPVDDLVLDVYWAPGSSQLRIDFNANPACYTVKELDAHQRRFVRFVHALAANATQPIGQIDLLDAEERHRLLVEWNATQQAYPSHQCIHQLFEAQVERTPEATALVYENQTLSYAQLNDRANQLAHYLRTLDVGPEAVVGLCAERSLEAIIGLLGILKAGGAYLPLDPSHPAERLASMLRQASVAVLVTQSHLEARLPEIKARRIDLDTDWAKIAACPKTPPDSGVTAEHLAYIIYTSGSTGQPKGVMHSHRGVVNYLSFLTRHYAITCADTILNITGLAFDPCMRDLFGPLTAGARVIMVPNEQAKEPGRYLSAIRERSVTKLLSITPSFLRGLCETVPAGPIASSLNTILTSGEPLEASVCEQVHKAFGPQVTVVNQYGPSECTMASTWFKADAQQEGRVPIGRPVPNVRVYVLGQHLELMPIGVTGELYIAGPGVARGYINQPELSAERFIPSPLSPGERLYRTGDLARWRLDGQLEYIGRVDQQIKIRGFRIEPGEIEAALVKHPSIAQSVVVSREDHLGDRRLVAYWVAADGGAMTPVELKAYLSQTLPDYMVPVAFVQLDTLPLTLSGKLNQRALPAPDGAAFALQVYEAPQGELETALAAIWSELLGVKRVGRHDNFFTLGGHSLLAIRLIERLRRVDLELSVRTLFDTPVLSVLAQSLGQHRDVAVPANRITRETTALTPDLLPLIELTQAEIDRIVEQVPGGVANIQDIYALSPLQDGILVHHLLATDGDPYLAIAQLAFDSRERLDQYLAAVQQVINRHDILRTAFVWEGLSTSAQVVWRQAPLSVIELTLDAKEGPIAEQLARRFDPRHTRLDLTQAPLLRFAIAQDTDGRWLAVQLLHHLIGDHSTLEVMHAEVRAFIEGEGETLPAAQPFRNLVAQARLGVSQTGHERFFTEQLADIEEPTLPFGLTDVHRDGVQVAEAHWMLPQALNDRLRAHAKRLGVSLASLCHLAWAQVLARASGQQHVVFGTVLFGRMQAGEGADSAMGLFINTLPLRVDLDGSVEAAVRATHARLAALLEHEHASLALAQRCSGVPVGTPLFSALLNYRHNAVSTGESGRLPGVELLSAQERTNYPLALSVEDFGQALGLTAQVVTSLDADRVCGYMQQVLESLAEALETTPEWPVEQLEVLPNEERTLLFETWNATQQDYPAHQCIHQLFEAQVERTPQAPALVYEERTLSYVELNAQANRFAHQLIELGVKPDARVAICVQRSPAMVVGLLAILKAGGAYVPLDPSYPGERLAHILADAVPNIVLADAAGRAALGEAALTDRTVLDPNRLPAQAETNPVVPDLTSRHLAYVIYTSGSTGVPKGVMVHHQGVVRLVRNTDYIKVEPGAVFALASNLAFDATTFEIWAPLLNGARIEVIERETLLSPATLARKLKQSGVTVLFLTTALFNQMVKEKVEAFSDLHYLLFGGENADPRCVFRVLQQAKPRHLLHVYGPTETVTYASWYEVRNVKQDTSIPIGRPIANTRIYLLDRYGQPVPLGAVGELYIGGAGVAHGYLNRPELTAERFVRDPFVDEADARMYKTGDLARYLPDGNLEFLGRNDHQVKIRGFRIELGEIEACLTQHAQVRETVVLAVGEGPDKRLVAYVVAEPDEQLANTLRTHVAAVLPEYMVPSAFVQLDAFPLTPNGKLDRRALPAPSAEAFAHQVYEAPQGVLETTLAEIWSELLGVERISRHDNFFALGGHSLLAVRLMNRAAALGITLPLATLFAAPTLAGLAAVLEAQRTSDGAALPAITPISRDGALPLSFAQQRLWFLAQLDGASESYHMSMALRLRGTLNRVAWQQALDALWARHEALRSVFVSVEGQPQVQLLPAEAGMPMTWHDLRGVRDAKAQLVRLSAEAAQVPFDLAHGPLMRACGVQLADDEYVMLLVQHHIVSDGWSIGVLVRELNTLYRAACDGQADPLPALTIQYPDYAAWQRQWLSGERLKAQSEYWRMALADAPVLLALPTDRPRPTQQSFAGAYVPIRIDASITQALKRLSQAHGATLFMTVLAAWSAVLARLSGQEDLVIGTPSANRHHPQIEPLIGFFVNTLALRLDVSGEPSATQLLERVRRTTLEAQAHQDVPFEQVVEIVQPPRRLEHTPLFQVMFAWQSNERAVWDLPEVEVTPADWAYDVAKFDLNLHLHEAGGEMVGVLHYATALFDRATIERHIGYLQTMLQAMAADAQQPVTRVELLSPAERTLLLQTWNATQRDYPAHQCIHQLFEAQVERTPEAMALVYEEQTLSYAQLNAQANRLAHQLIELGVQPDARVAICVQRSPAMVVGLLAILKAGGAYVPLDPAYPDERLAHILTDAAPDIVLADAAGRAALGKAALAHRTVLDPNVLPARADTNPSVLALTSRHLAYVIYTSGSTGIPKGVLVQHSGVVNHGIVMAQRLGLSSRDRLLQFSSLSFDASVEEIFCTLCYGATLVLRTDAWLADAKQFWDLCEANRISLVDLPTQFWAQLIQEKAAVASSVRAILIGGDTLSASTQSAWLAGGHRARLLNTYGPTETTVIVTIYEVVDESDHGRCIGRPIANTRIYLLDRYGQPVPLGAVGELYIGGAGVARGYLNRPELTAERFVRDPFVGEPDARMYKTGDLARYLPDGNLEFLGRNDHQVKLRGFRIELGEIEACLTQHTQVHDAVVLARGEGQDKRLVAYVVADPDDALAGTLRTHVAAALPEYMVPSAFVRLDALPLTPNGKLDRRALPAPSADAFAHQAYEAPQGELEATLAEIWSELLGVERISRHDNFFALGGHSLLAVQMISRSRTALGVSIPMPVLFEAPTLAALAQRVSVQENVQDESFAVLLPIQPHGARPALFCVHPVTGLSWHYRGLVSHLEADQPVYGLQARGLDGGSLPAVTIEAMAIDYIQQIRRIQPRGPYYLLGWSFGGKVVHSMATQLEQQGERVALLAVLDATPDYVQRDNKSKITEDDFYHLFVRHAAGSLSEAGHYLWEKTRAVLQNNVQLVQNFSPRTYGGDMLFFRATMARDAWTQPISPEVWQPYVLGNIEVHDIACQHYDMELPVPTAQIGRILRQKLNALQAA